MLQMLDLKTQYRELKDEIDAAVRGVLESGHFIMGPNVQALEEEAAAYLGAGHAVSCNSGTDALHFALRAAGVGPGDEVITTAFTFVATVEAIHYVGARPVYVDIDPRTFNLDPAGLEAKIGPATRAIMPVHLFGLSADMTRIAAIAEAHGLAVIEDAAQSFGAGWGDRMAGTFGAFGCFSFYPTKTLGGYGDGGMVTTSSDELAERIRSLRNHGQRGRYRYVEIGYNSRLDELQAAILRVKLRHLDASNARRREIAAAYGELLQGTPLELPVEPEGARHIYGQYTVLCERRDTLMQGLAEAGIASIIYYPTPLHKQEFCAGEHTELSLPVTEHVAARCLSLPLYPEMDHESVRRVADGVRAALARA